MCYFCMSAVIMQTDSDYKAMLHSLILFINTYEIGKSVIDTLKQSRFVFGLPQSRLDKNCIGVNV